MAGIVVEMEYTNPDKGAAGGYRALAGGAVIRDLRVSTDTGFSPRNGPPTPVEDDDFFDSGTNSDILRTSSGIVLFAQARIDNCYVNGFEHDGIHINSSVGRGTGPDSWHIENCVVQQNGRHGLFVTGGDSNVGCAINLTCNSNYKWGVYDHSFLGNTYVMCHVEDNGHINQGPDDPVGNYGGGYRTITPTNMNLFLGCYAELGQRNILRYPSTALAGLVGNGFEEDPLTTRSITVLSGGGQLAVDALQVHGPMATKTRLIQTIASGTPQSITRDDNVVLVDAITGDVPLTLPGIAGSDFEGLHLTIKKIDAGSLPVTIAPASPAAESIDGVGSVELNQPFSWIILTVGRKSPGTGAQMAWYVIGRG